MNGVGAGRLGRCNDRLRVEVSRSALPGQKLHLIGDAKVQAFGVVLGMNRDGGQSHIGGGARDADGELAAIGNQELCDFHASF